MSEKDFAKKHGFKLVKNSGRGMIKGDMTKGNTVADLKEVTKSFTVNERVWNKCASDASKHGWDHKPMLILSFVSGTELIVMDYNDYDWGDDDGTI